MLKRSSIAGMPCLFFGILIYIRTTQKSYKGEETRQYDTHLQEAEQAQPMFVYQFESFGHIEKPDKGNT